MLYYNLQNIDINNDHTFMKIISDIRYSLSKIGSFENKILVVKIQDVANDDNSMIPKLEFKNV